MSRLRKFSILLLLFPVLVSSSVIEKNNEKGEVLNMVTCVRVICHQSNCSIERQYVQPHKISAVLYYLRLLKCRGQVGCDPEQLTGDNFEIILYDANGPCSIYRQRGNRFFSKNSGPWKNIPPEQASLLLPLIQSMSSDAVR